MTARLPHSLRVRPVLGALTLLLAAGPATALTVTRAELRNGDELRLEGSGAAGDATILVDGSALGAADANGDFRIETAGFSSPTCVVAVSDGIATTNASLEGCTPSGPPPNQPPVADAGADQVVVDADRDGVAMVTLDGSASTDPDGSIVSWSWTENGVPLAAVGAPGTTALARSPDWAARLPAALAAAEYRPGPSRAGLQAPNRAHGLRTVFEPSGIRVHDRLAPVEGPPLVRLALARVGRPGALTAVAAGDLAHEGTRVEIRRPGLVEWYDNSARGLEQGFAPASAPPGEGPLVLELALAGAEARADGESVALATAAGRRLAYGGLRVLDAQGRPLASHLEVPEPARVRIVVDDRGAAYPLDIDPLLTSLPDQQLESDQPDPPGFLPATFGANVAPAGDVNGDGFDDVLVGAPGWDGGDPHEGAVFVFLGSASGLVGANPATAHARIESDQPGAELGSVPRTRVGDVNGDGFDDIVVGAHTFSSTLPGTALEVHGAAFVFLGSAAGITATTVAQADATILGNEFLSALGLHVSGAGDVNGDGFADIVVGVPDHGTPFPPGIPPNQRSGDLGAALVFHGGPAGITGTGFGDADAVILAYEDTGLPDPPIFGAIGPVAGAGDVNGDGFDDLVVGGSEIAIFPGSPAGVVGRDLAEAATRIPADQPLGLVVSGAGDVNGDGFDDVVAGAAFRELEPNTARQEGAAYVFLGGPNGLTASTLEDAHAAFFGVGLAEWVGARVAGAGDVDGDGFGDVLVTAREYAGSLASEGVSYLLRGGPAGITAPTLHHADVRLEVPQSGAVVLGNNAALDAAGVGDVNGDGFDDVLVGKGFYDAGQENEGAAFLFLGGPWPAVPNAPPVAHAGPDQVVLDLDGDGTETVQVDGSASFDPDGTLTSTVWKEGETVLGTAPALATPLAATGDHTLVFDVTDDAGVRRGDPVVVRVDTVPSAQAFFDVFDTLDGWTATGDVSLVNAGTFPTPPQVRLAGAGASLVRTLPLPPGATGVTLEFWAHASGFAPGDTLEVRVRPNGGAPLAAHVIDAGAADGTWTFHGGTAIPVGVSWHPATATTVDLELAGALTGGVVLVDDLVVRALQAPTGLNLAPTADAGPDQVVPDPDADGFARVTVDGSASSDPDGTLRSFEWREGGALLGTTARITRTLAAGSHVLELTVVDDAGGVATDTVQVTVDAPAMGPVMTVPLGLGVHQIVLQVTDDQGATASDTVQVTVRARRACGLGFELVALLTPLAWLRRRRGAPGG